MEESVGQRSVELQQRHQSGRRHVLEAGEWPEHLVHLNELRNVVLGKLQSLFALEIGGAGEPLMQVV
jgi:hypothetical protein